MGIQVASGLSLYFVRNAESFNGLTLMETIMADEFIKHSWISLSFSI
ncbi:hypothetical protein KEJ48_07255 [Candidatus Bathyarchaeota archaeon]|nr:hypothetical protein [Candidatus Bathyarchaeota archaeon]